MEIRNKIKKLIKQKDISIRELSRISKVRRQSIAHFLEGGNLHLKNLEAVLKALKLTLKVEKDKNIIEEKLNTNTKAVMNFCKKNKITFLAVFGSILTDNFTNESDIDILIDFKKPVSYFEFAEIEDGLKKIFKTTHDLDVLTLNSLSPLIKEKVLEEYEVLYETAS